MRWSAFVAVTFITFSAAHATEMTRQPEVEVVFVLDTTGSMSGLIEGAKQKIWSIANTIAQGRPTPKLRMGLVAYRDRNDDYVTKHFPLTDDLDAMYASLMQFRAEGGGDMPESVNTAVQEAVDRMQWSTGIHVYRTIFLVGDAPPHMDYQDDQRYSISVAKARDRGIVVNTVQCGSIQETMPVWREIAQLGKGEYFQIDQGGGMAAIATPYDQELIRLSRELEQTRLYWGTAVDKHKQELKFRREKMIDAAAPAEGLASRAAINVKSSGEKNFLGEKELVHDVTTGAKKLDELKDEELPAELRPLPPAEREKSIRARSDKRVQIQAQISELDRKRQDYLRSAESSRPRSGFDSHVVRAVQSQAAGTGIRYPSER